MKRILLVEDDLSLINGLSFAVKKQGYQLDVAHTSSEADSLWEAGRYDLVILDVTLPDGSGFDICRNIRKTSKVPIMFLTAMDEETDIIMGLDIGGDDYITKPFKPSLLYAKCLALLKRNKKIETNQLQSGKVILDLDKHVLVIEENDIVLTDKEFKLLRYLMKNQGIVYQEKKF